MKQLNIILALGCTVLLSACHLQNQERTLLLNPSQLKQTVMNCQTSQQVNATLCQKAGLVAQVVSEYSRLEQQYGNNWLEMRNQYYALQSQIASEQNPIKRQKLLEQQNNILLAAGESQFLVQQEFAKLIMRAESQLADLEAQEKTASGADKVAIQEQIKTVKEQIKIMLTMVGINIPSP